MKQLTENDVLTFGKYKGSIIGNILLMDPTYLLWAKDNVKWFEMTSELYARIVVAEHMKNVRNGMLILDYPDTTAPLLKVKKEGRAPLPVNKTTPVITRESFKSPLRADIFQSLRDDARTPLFEDENDPEMEWDSFDGGELDHALDFDMNDYGDR